MDSRETIQNIFELIKHKQRLERERGVYLLRQLLTENRESDLKLVSSLLLDIFQQKDEPWETYHGALLSCFPIILSMDQPKRRSLPFVESFVLSLCDECLSLLFVEEVRVRTESGKVLGSLCQHFGPSVFESCKEAILSSIRANLHRDDARDAEIQEAELRLLHSKFAKSKNRGDTITAEQIFHDTAGWRHLETSVLCLQEMIAGCGSRFIPYIDEELLDLVNECITHPNRFVRETGHYTIAGLIKVYEQISAETDTDPLYPFGQRFAEMLSLGLADNWSQVRLAASISTRAFFTAVQNPSVRTKYFPLLLPRMCLNRYYLAEGVRLYSQDTWSQVFQTEGRQTVQTYLKEIVEYYVNQAQADNHAVREATCHCIAELGMKIPEDVLAPYVKILLSTLVASFEDDSWPVRDAACLACGNFIQRFPEETKSMWSTLRPLSFRNLEDNILSVRQGAAVTIAAAVKAYGEEVMPEIFERLKTGLENVKNQPTDSQRFKQLQKGATVYGVPKPVPVSDCSDGSCQALAPKLLSAENRRRSSLDGNLARTFVRPIEPWEVSDGCIHLLAELSKIESLARQLEPYAEIMIEAARYSDYQHHCYLLDTFCHSLPVILRNLGKPVTKRLLERCFEPIFIAVECGNILASTTASVCLKDLAEFLGEKILRSRIEMWDDRKIPAYLDAIGSA